MAIPEKKEYVYIAGQLGMAEEQLGNLSAGIRFHASAMPTDIANELRSLASSIRKDAERTKQLREKYERIAKNH